MKLLLLILFVTSVLSYEKRDYTKRQYYTLHTTHPNDKEAAQQVAHSLNARYEGHVGELEHYFWISIPSMTNRSQDSVIQQFEERRKRSLDRVDQIQPQIPSKRLYKRAPPPPVIENKEEEYKLNDERPPPFDLPLLSETDGYERIKDLLSIHDPGFDQQWHLVNREEIGHDLNVTGVWSQGITGQDTVVAILDDGLDMDHLDLQDNYFAEGSYDFNNHSPSPKPRLEDDTHGTRCAGEIAAVKNDVCGLGVAYSAKVAGIRILSSEITEADEAAALNYAYQQNHIYSCSWGPPDLGEVAEAPQGIILEAIKNGITKGRNGTGSIFVFASGNGGANDDNCNFDGYTNSIYTITVGAIDKLGNHPYYSERCSAQLVVTYSSGSGGYIYTTDIGDNKCSDRHGGTSAAAPLAAGVFALVLSARPDLTWRDMQHLCVQSAIPISLGDDDWSTLPSGRMFNHKYGYGALDAYRIVELAKTFESVRAQTNLQVYSVIDPLNEKMEITDISAEVVDKSKAFTSTLVVTQEMVDKVGLERLEHVTATVNIEHQRRGDLEVLLESPNGVSSQLAAPRKYDKSDAGLIDWTFMTVKHWEENAVGNWTLRIVDAKNPEYKGFFIDWKLTLWGEIRKGYTPVADNTTSSDVSVDDFENESFLDKEQPKSSIFVYSLVSVFMVISVASTAFIVKKYMLSAAKSLNYTRPSEQDAFEFENLISGDDQDELEEEDEQEISHLESN